MVLARRFLSSGIAFISFARCIYGFQVASKIFSSRTATASIRKNHVVFSEEDQTNESFGEFHEEKEGKKEGDDDRLTNEELLATMGEWDPKIPKFNSVHLVGRIGQQPEARYLQDGKVVVNISIACRRKYHPLERKELKIASGQEETIWYPLEIWGSTAEFVSKYVDKGARVGVIGKLQIDSWNDKETGEPRERAKVIVRQFDVLETKAEAELRRSNRGNYGGGNNSGSYGGGSGNGGNNSGSYDNDNGGRKSFAFSDDEDDGSPAAGTGGFFSDDF